MLQKTKKSIPTGKTFFCRMNSMEDYSLSLPETLDSALVIDEMIRVRKDRLRYHKTHVQDYFVVSSSDEAVSIIALSSSDEILVTREYRHPTKKVLLGF